MNKTLKGRVLGKSEVPVHELKTLDVFFQEVKKGNKPFEIRKDDREYKVGDFLLLRGIQDNQYTGEECIVQISYIFGREDHEKPFVLDGYVILGILLVDTNN